MLLVCRIKPFATALDAFYVDDLLTSASTEEELVVLIDELGRLLSSRGFHLTKFSSNSERVLATVPWDRLASSHRSFEFGNLPTGMALGVAYNPATNDFVVMAKIEERPMIKQGIVSMTSQFFDPIGFLQPYLLVAKLIVQRVCKDVTSWDDDIGEDNQAAMKNWLSATPCLQNIKLPRCCFGLAEAVSVELHAFSDASTIGMGVVSYLSMYDGDRYTLCFVARKSRVAPGKSSMTIPRLELCAAVVAAKVAHQIVKEHRCVFSRIGFWADATVILRNLNDTKSRYKVFVANRIAAIHAYSAPNQWRYVDSASNPADVFFRGLHPRDWTASQSYLAGPGFLLGDESEWPVLPLCSGSKTCGLEEIVSCVAATASDDSLCNLSNDSLYQLFLRYSSVLQRLVRTIAWLRRFLKWLQHRFLKSQKYVDADTGVLSAAELHVFCECAVKIAQRQIFSDVAVAVEAHGWRDTVKGVKENRCKQQLKSLSKLCPIAVNGVFAGGGQTSAGQFAV